MDHLTGIKPAMTAKPLSQLHEMVSGTLNLFSQTGLFLPNFLFHVTIYSIAKHFWSHNFILLPTCVRGFIPIDRLDDVELVDFSLSFRIFGDLVRGLLIRRKFMGFD